MATPPDSRMQQLLAEGDFVRSLARRLIGDADADDLVQDTWVTALRHRPRALQWPRAWLAQIVRRLASNRSRGEQRRRRREEDVARMQPSEGPSTAEILACEQARQRVVAAVLALDEPFRATVLARFYECLDADAIAARERIAVATVRSRLKRGLDRLRSRLDAEHGGRAAWAAPLDLLCRGGAELAIPAGAIMSAKKLVVAGAAVLALVGSCLFALLPGPASPQPLASPAALSIAATAVGGDAPSRQDAVAARVAVEPAAFRGEPRERVPYPLVDEPVDEVGVRVLDADTRLPVADAEVLYLPFRIDVLNARTRGDRELQEAIGSEAFFERFGSRARTDKGGCATIRLPRLWSSTVIASHGVLWVRGDITPTKLMPGERATLWLDDPRWIRIRVVDEASGAPLRGEMVEVNSAGAAPVVPGSCGDGGVAGPSDADGMIRLPWSRRREAIIVRVWTAGGECSVPLDLPAALDRVTELRCPATGSMTIELRTPAGRLWPGQIDGYVSPEGGGWPAPTSGPVSWRNAEPGVYRVPGLELGRRYKVGVQLHHIFEPGANAVVDGPKQAGEDVRVVLHLRTEPCLLHASLRLADGSLPPSSWLAHVVLDRAASAETRTWRQLDADGGIGWNVPIGASAVGSIELATGRGEFEPLLQCAWRLEAATAGEHDLGTLVLADAPVVVAGELDLGGAAWQGPPVKILCEIPAADGSWAWLQQIVVQPDHSRSFALRGITKAERVRVTVLADRHFAAPDPVIVRTGTRDLRLAIQRGLPLRARVLAPAAYAQTVRCRAVREDGAALPAIAEDRVFGEQPPRSEATLVDFDGTAAQFAWPALPAGSYRVDVLAPGIERPLASIAGVELAADAPPDPRLDPIDVRAGTRTLLVVVDPLPQGPRPITDGGAFAFPAGRPEGTRHGLLFDAHGQARLLVGPDPVDVIVGVPGFRLWRAHAVTDNELRVALEPCLQVRLRLAPRVAERLAGQRVEVELEPRDARPDHSSPPILFHRAGERDAAVQTSLTMLQILSGAGRAAIDDAGLAAIAVPVSAPGTFHLALTIGGKWPDAVRIEDERLNMTSPCVCTPSRFAFAGPDDPPVVIDLDDDTIARILDLLSRRR